MTLELNSIGFSSFVVSIVLSFLATLAVVIRFYTRGKLNNGLGLDDWLILASLPFFYLYVVDVLYGVIIYAGVEEWKSLDTQVDHLTKYLKSLYFLAPAYGIPITFVKLSIIAFYRRLFTVGHFPKISGIVGIICFAWFIAGFIAGFLYCIPMHKFWDIAAEGHCYNFNTFFLTMEILNLLLDVAILGLPIRMISKLKLPMRKKVMISGIFLLGGFVCVTGVLRIILVYKPNNVFISFTGGALWTAVQLGVAIICACLPTYGPLWPPIKSFGSSLRNIYASMLGTSTRQGTSTTVTESGNGIPGTNSYYKKMDGSNNDHIHLTEISGMKHDQDSTSSDELAIQGIRVKREVDVV